MKKVFLSFFLLVFTAYIDLSAAQDGPYYLDDIVVTASRIKTPLVEAPANVDHGDDHAAEIDNAQDDCGRLGKLCHGDDADGPLHPGEGQRVALVVQREDHQRSVHRLGPRLHGLS